MKMLEDLDRLMSCSSVVESLVYGEERREAFRVASTLSLQFLRTHHATIRDMAARLEAANALLRECDAVARKRGDKYGLCDAIDNGGEPYQSAHLAKHMQEAGR